MRILILANGAEPSHGLLHSFHRRCDLFIAADGGGHTSLKLGFEPDIITGDMDSFDEQTPFKGTLLKDPDQETNDLEKALSLAIKKNATRVDVLGATGKRLDHSLKNLSVMLRFNPSFKAFGFYDDEFSTRILPKTFETTLPIGHTVSLFPLSGLVSGITTKGLRYPLTNETLENGKRDGTSNETMTPHIHISYKSGALLFISAFTDKDLD